jgi:hypothetical protein
MSRKFERRSWTSKPQATYSATLGTGSALRTSVNNLNGDSRPLPIPKTKAGIPIPDTHPLIPLPSFATVHLSRSTPRTAFVKNGTTRDEDRNGQSGTEGSEEDDMPVDDEGYDYEKAGEDEGERIEESSVLEKKKSTAVMKRPLHLWHAALALILERGRPVTRAFHFLPHILSGKRVISQPR